MHLFQILPVQIITKLHPEDFHIVDYQSNTLCLEVIIVFYGESGYAISVWCWIIMLRNLQKIQIFNADSSC